ncbi:hypothetical protein J31TS4_03590 [Paenibacillus sp. J31TS4]|uniref:hypothetical protein n=1 Tax=Paenibacillus sp. J31TS4 TaxID=2807195 RepID=UPI001B0794DA|nr:hypothetical protein [Paenibacillus sp. J31TS4]GIP37079.1 hypothetical protein J31TS4_03590 [Paenibacillus sp. J31TS4]
MRRKQTLWLFLCLVLIVCLFSWRYVERTPKIHGQSVEKVTILDPHGRTVLVTLTSDDRTAIDVVAKAISQQSTLIELNKNEPNYWIQHDTNVIL